MSLLLPTREAFVETPVRELGIHLNPFHRGIDFLHPGTQLGRLAIERGLCRTQEVGHRHARHLYRILHRQEKAGPCPLINGERKQILVVESHTAGRDVVLRVSCNRVRQGRFARTIRSHDRVRLAAADRQINSLEDFLRTGLGVDRHVKVTNSQSGHERSELLCVGGSSGGIGRVGIDGRRNVDQNITALDDAAVDRDRLCRR